MIQLSVNGRGVEVPEGATLLQAARTAGVHLATLCHHPRLPSHAVCRMCLVEVRGQSRPVPACVTPAEEGQAVRTDSPGLQDFRRQEVSWLLARHPKDCMRCEAGGSCKLQDLARESGSLDGWNEPQGESPERPAHLLADHTSPSIWRDLAKCVDCGLCVEACGEAGQQQHVIGFAGRGTDRLPVTIFEKPLSETKCISCGQCTLVCPVGALVEAPHWRDVLPILDARRRITVVQVAPATRVTIGEEFGLAPGAVSTGRMINALRRLGFDYVFDTNFAADVTILEEGAELLERLRSRHRLPIFTSCCPGWVNWVEINRPDLLPHLSTTKSPQQMHGALTKRGRFARSLGGDFAQGRAEPYVVSVMPCTAKKDEAARPGMSEDVDRALTTRELARMIRARGIAFGALAEDGVFDSPLGASTGAAQIFGASGGVMEAMVRTATHLLGREDSLSLDWKELRGVEGGIRAAQVPGVGKVAVCNGIAAAQRLVAGETWREEFVAIEVMACVGGCLGGGGEPKSDDPQILQKRARAIYELDRQAPRRRSHEPRRAKLKAPLVDALPRLRRSPRCRGRNGTASSARLVADGLTPWRDPLGCRHCAIHRHAAPASRVQPRHGPTQRGPVHGGREPRRRDPRRRAMPFPPRCRDASRGQLLAGGDPDAGAGVDLGRRGGSIVRGHLENPAHSGSTGVFVPGER